MLLSIDTSTKAIGAALYDDRVPGGSVLASAVHLDSRRHGELLAPAIVQILEEAQVDRTQITGIVCGVGPGPFTGLRVGVVTALVLARSLDLPRPAGVCSLDALAHSVIDRHEGALLVATDARRKEVYWAVYDVRPTGAHRVSGPGVCRAADLPADVRALPTLGRGHELYPEALTHPLDDAPLDVDPGVLADLAARLIAGEHGDAQAGEGWGLLVPEPLYLRRPDAVALPVKASR
ncbi:MAG: tRNA (adenosine(37)-N6)-threonylcarbamoyltransferase complex dimerization subunit type 1 TsaB [Ornithinimicrobium sp.]|uniref:tRNA (adenosine(37)-N6)-threonylcarbamoyltransferase complex dimerization subunit type 1 TsaB n=1 Tax=Ornithinimicrobium sp. TaxID=1977084 RepID=UPI0026DF7E2D|nr:tRNA (adenosine(37)-N6)-threonylcarbamoyltransferase complex dimerization subunit type 1 TsaB [Ornithinimicrobium sp.]MDO5738871.1 tRNA (adenosine(37)-N6)-threonylcarbamoyltransferase complex dimerization subunit type 1 TsaB [Ornithinimicrobium sp.]